MRRLQSELSQFALEAWIRPLEIREDGDRLCLLAPGQFHKKRVEARFLARIRDIAAGQANRPVSVEVELLSEEREPAREQPHARRTAPAAV